VAKKEVPVKKYYLYTCYCGPQITRLDAERGKHNGYIYENCPAISAPALNHTFDDLTDYRVPTIVKNLENIKTLFKSYGLNRAHLIGSFVQNQTKRSSDIDFAADLTLENHHLKPNLVKALETLLGNKCDITSYKTLNAFPHNVFEKASILLFEEPQ
jgi:predicted nucleotidyltransferase